MSDRLSKTPFDFQVKFGMVDSFQVLKPLILKLRFNQAVMLSYLIHESMNRKEVNGWFACPQQQIHEWLGISPRQQANILKPLIKAKCIETSRRSTPMICGELRRNSMLRWIRVNYDQIGKMIRRF